MQKFKQVELQRVEEEVEIIKPPFDVNDCCVVTFSDKKDENIDRLSFSIQSNFSGTFVSYSKYDDIDCPLTHEQNPFAFRLYSIVKAFKLGYTKVLWCDSDVFATKDIEPLFKTIHETGYLLQCDDKNIGCYASDKSLSQLNMHREVMVTYKGIDTNVFGIDFRDDTASSLIGIMSVLSNKSHFIGDAKNFDVNMSIMALKLGLNFHKIGWIFSYNYTEQCYFCKNKKQ